MNRQVIAIAAVFMLAACAAGFELTQTQCPAGQFLRNGQCYSCSDQAQGGKTGCVNCALNGTTVMCSECAESYHLVTDPTYQYSQCVQCNIPHCTECMYGFPYGRDCIKCELGYGMAKSGAVDHFCVVCSVKNCPGCQINNDGRSFCYQCLNQFYLNNNTCTPCTDIDPFCEDCTMQNSVPTCTKCLPTFTLRNNQCEYPLLQLSANALTFSRAASLAILAALLAILFV